MFNFAPLVPLAGIEPTTTAPTAGPLAAGVLLSWSNLRRVAPFSLPPAPFRTLCPFLRGPSPAACVAPASLPLAPLVLPSDGDPLSPLPV